MVDTMAVKSEEPILRMQHIGKSFPGVRALDNVFFDLYPGEVHALVGENGAGKSTLMKVLGGLYQPDEGVVEIDGVEEIIHSPRDALSKHISTIYQELNLVPEMSVAANVYLGREHRTAGVPFLDRKSMARDAKKILARLGLDNVDVNAPLRTLSIAQQQLVEVAKAMSEDARVLVFDEPTAVLSQKESEALFELIEAVRDQGIGIVYISHRLEEVLRLADRITVLRDGKNVGSPWDLDVDDVAKDDIVQRMVGREMQNYFPDRKEATSSDTVCLSVRGLTVEGQFNDVSFDLRKGEILGVYGLVGAGRSEIMKTICNLQKADRGVVKLNGEDLTGLNPGKTIAKGVTLVPEDRKLEGLFLWMSMTDNIAIPNYRRASRFGFVREFEKSRMATKYFEELQIRPNLPDRSARNFSGGNQQKGVIAKWLEAKPKVLIFDEPTRGIDIGAKAEIYKMIRNLADQGVSIILVSSELVEVIGVSDRILVVHEGELSGEFPHSEANEQNIMMLATGSGTIHNAVPTEQAL